MTSILQTIENLFIDRENVNIELSFESVKLNQQHIQRSTLPFSELKNRKFRRLFDRHSITR